MAWHPTGLHKCMLGVTDVLRLCVAGCLLSLSLSFSLFLASRAGFRLFRKVVPWSGPSGFAVAGTAAAAAAAVGPAAAAVTAGGEVVAGPNAGGGGGGGDGGGHNSGGDPAAATVRGNGDGAPVAYLIPVEPRRDGTGPWLDRSGFCVPSVAGLAALLQQVSRQQQQEQELARRGAALVQQP